MDLLCYYLIYATFIESHFVPDSTVGAGETAVNKTDMSALIQKSVTINPERLNCIVLQMAIRGKEDKKTEEINPREDGDYSFKEVIRESGMP